MSSESEKLYETVFDYFENEFASILKQLEDGMLTEYKERVITSRKLDESLSLLSPYVRNDSRARQLVRDAEVLKKRLLSVRDIISGKPYYG